MRKKMLKCKYSLCGKEYDGCVLCNKSSGVHWSDVACCPEHFQGYMKEVLEARGEIEKEDKVKEASLDKTQEKEIKIKKTNKN